MSIIETQRPKDCKQATVREKKNSEIETDIRELNEKGKAHAQGEDMETQNRQFIHVINS